jgi:hypothetical protein
MQLIWKSMGDFMFHREYNWEVRNTVIPSKLYLWPLCPGPVRVQGIVFLQQSAPSAYQRKLLMVLLGLPGGWGCVINRHILPVGLVKPEILLCQKDQISQRICEDRRQTNKICSTLNLSVYYFVNFVILCELLKTCQYTLFFFTLLFYLNYVMMYPVNSECLTMFYETPTCLTCRRICKLLWTNQRRPSFRTSDYV